MVCDRCLQASCVQGIFMCEENKNAGITLKTTRELKRLNYEHSDYWKRSNDMSRFTWGRFK